MASRHPPARQSFPVDPEDLCDGLPSTCLSRACYNEDTGQLDITFLESGRTYRYYNVPIGKAKYLMQRAPSAGRYYNTKIKGQFQRRKLPGSRS